MYYWDGQAWISTLSPDGRQRWDGARWVAATAATQYGPPPGAAREPTSWTRPLQYAVIAWYGLSVAYALTIPFWMGGAMSDLMRREMERQQANYPPREAPPPGFIDTMTTFMTDALWIVVFVSFVIAIVAIAGALRRWTWTYYAVLVLLGLGLFALPADIGNVLSGGRVSGATGLGLPSWSYWAGLVSAILGAALFAWMLVALVKRGPWGMKRVS